MIEKDSRKPLGKAFIENAKDEGFLAQKISFVFRGKHSQYNIGDVNR